VTDPLRLMPMPRHVTRTGGSYRGPARFAEVRTGSDPEPQRYRIDVEPCGIRATATDAAGRAYAERTLAQLAAQFGDEIPCLTIDDWPDFPVRGVMLDISRDKVPTMATLRSLVDRLAGWKINQLQLYTEHTFAYSAHRTAWEHASPLTADEVRELDGYCRERFIELVPNQNSFGHMERWLKHERYRHLAEAPDGAETPWGFRWDGPFSLCPTDPASVGFLAGLYAELLPNFGSGLFNVGCDETFDIGQGRSWAEAERVGVTGVYLDFLRKVNGLVRGQGRRMMFWGDVILHHPERIADLPPDAIALNWGYEADHPFEVEAAAFAAAGVPFYVCPGTSSWNSIAGRTDNCLANLRNAAGAGRKHGAIGYLITDWGDNGHLQYLSTSYLGFMAGAAISWCGDTNADIDWRLKADSLKFLWNGGLGRALYDLGNVYQSIGKANANGSALFRLLVPPPSDATPERGLTAANLDSAEAAIAAAESLIPAGHRNRPPLTGSMPGGFVDAAEAWNTATMLRFCVAAGRRRLGQPTDADPAPVVAEHRRLWLLRNRPGGLDDSCRRIQLPD
jgi:hexosaminidase